MGNIFKVNNKDSRTMPVGVLVCMDVPKPSITGSRDYKVMTSLKYLEKFPMDSYQTRAPSVQI